jgi:hypothetical protein
LLLPLERFSRDDINREIHKVWNEKETPLYGGSVLDPVERKIWIHIEEGEDVPE